MSDLFLTEPQLRARQNAKWTMFPADVLPAWVAEMDFTLSPAIRHAVGRLTEEQDLGYPIRAGGVAENAIGPVFAQRMLDRYGWTLDPALVQPVADLVQGTFAPILAFSDPGDGVILQTPAYPPFYEAINTTGRRLDANPMIETEQGYRLDFDGLEAAIKPDTRILALCNPQNPTGRVFTREELDRLAAIAERHDLIVIADEIHADLTHAPFRHIPFASLSPQAEARTVTITSATKSHNIPGLRCALLHFGSAALKERFHARIPRRLLGAPSIYGIDATIAAWRDSDAWQAEVGAVLTANRDHLVARLEAELPQARLHAPEGIYMAWVDFSAYKLDRPAQKFLLDEARVALSAGETFQPDLGGFARINFATSPQILAAILDRIVAAVRVAGSRS